MLIASKLKKLNDNKVIYVLYITRKSIQKHGFLNPNNLNTKSHSTSIDIYDT